VKKQVILALLFPVLVSACVSRIGSEACAVAKATADAGDIPGRSLNMPFDQLMDLADARRLRLECINQERAARGLPAVTATPFPEYSCIVAGDCNPVFNPYEDIETEEASWVWVTCNGETLPYRPGEEVVCP